MVATGCEKKASQAAAGASVMDISAPPAPVEPPMSAAQPVIYDSPHASTAAPANSSNSQHVVKKGETLYGIARQSYGDGKQWTRIADANPGINPKMLKVGQVLTVP
jgi:5'-nucleotidase / UDP-sugar diphosphatase